MTPGRPTSTEGNLQTPAWRAPREKQETQTAGTGTPENANVGKTHVGTRGHKTASTGTTEDQPGAGTNLCVEMITEHT